MTCIYCFLCEVGGVDREPPFTLLQDWYTCSFSDEGQAYVQYFVICSRESHQDSILTYPDLIHQGQDIANGYILSEQAVNICLAL